MGAFAAQVFPPLHGAPGAVELGAVQFVARALSEPFFAAAVPVVREGLADLDNRARMRRGGKDFASLDQDEQSGVIRQIEQGDFFKAARTLVLIGTFADPSHGGNRNGAAWMAIGIDHRPSYAPPFGFYDGLPVAQHQRGAA